MDCKENCLHCEEKCNTKFNTNQHRNFELKSELKDNEIIKALEVHSNEKFDNCEGCPYLKGDFCEGYTVSSKPFKDILDLINRQKAEIERLQCEVKNCRDVIKEQSDEWHKHYNDSVTYKTALDSVCKELRTAKSEAIKEFAEKVYRFLCNWRNWNKLKVSWLFNGECEWLKKSLDNLVKEMAESNELQQDF